MTMTESQLRDNSELGRLERDLRAVYGAYAYLRNHDLARVSTTSRLLREADLAQLARRVRDELDELRGVIDGTHGHGHGRDDVVLEAYQSLYWLTVLAVAAGDTYDDVRPHTALEREEPSPPAHADWSLGSADPTAQPALPAALCGLAPDRLRPVPVQPVRGRGEQRDAGATELEELDSADTASRRRAVRQAMTYLAGLCGHAGVAVAEPVARDLSELRARSYLAPYWEGIDA